MVCLLVEISRLCKNEKWAHSYVHLYSAFSPSSTKNRTGADLRSRAFSSAHFHLLRSPKPISNRYHKYRMSSGGYAASKEKKHARSIHVALPKIWVARLYRFTPPPLSGCLLFQKQKNTSYVCGLGLWLRTVYEMIMEPHLRGLFFYALISYQNWQKRACINSRLLTTSFSLS
jgi:hypothetical protein